jgi:hypothetical protein
MPYNLWSQLLFLFHHGVISSSFSLQRHYYVIRSRHNYYVIPSCRQNFKFVQTYLVRYNNANMTSSFLFTMASSARHSVYNVIATSFVCYVIITSFVYAVITTSFLLAVMALSARTRHAPRVPHTNVAHHGP